MKLLFNLIIVIWLVYVAVAFFKSFCMEKALTTVAIISGTYENHWFLVFNFVPSCSFYVARRGGAHSLYNQLHREGRLALHSLMGGVVVQVH